MGITRILELSSPIYQMEWKERIGILLVSALKTYVVCFTLTKTFYEMRRSSGKMQQIGACFLTDETIIISSLPFELSKTNVQG